MIGIVGVECQGDVLFGRSSIHSFEVATYGTGVHIPYAFSKQVLGLASECRDRLTVDIGELPLTVEAKKSVGDAVQNSLCIT
jgi:hypothetical protein